MATGVSSAYGETGDLPAVYVISFYLPDLAAKVQQLLPEARVIKIRPRPAVYGKLEENDIQMLQEEAEIIFLDTQFYACTRGCKKLRWVQAKASGVNYLLKEIDPDNPPQYLLTRLTANCTLVGEYVMMQVLARERNLLPMHHAQQQKQWQQVEMADARDITSLTMCVIGVGALGQEVARRCKQLGMRILGVTRSAPTADRRCADVDVYRTVEHLRLALGECDYICCAMPSTPETANLLSGDVLSVCEDKKPVLISVGRGDVIDEGTIVKSIREGWIRGAVLDVQPAEPLPETSPLWTLPNVFITPHIAGYCRNDKYVCTYASEFVENYRKFCRGEPMKNMVDFSNGY